MNNLFIFEEFNELEYISLNEQSDSDIKKA